MLAPGRLQRGSGMRHAKWLPSNYFFLSKKMLIANLSGSQDQNKHHLSNDSLGGWTGKLPLGRSRAEHVTRSIHRGRQSPRSLQATLTLTPDLGSVLGEKR